MVLFVGLRTWLIESFAGMFHSCACVIDWILICCAFVGAYCWFWRLVCCVFSSSNGLLVGVVLFVDLG